MFQDLQVQYQAGQTANWKGRETNPALGKQYWYQAIDLINMASLNGFVTKPTMALLGYVCEEGVRRNQGRVGAKAGPNSIRARLAKLAYHHDAKKIIDCGDLIAVEENMEDCQIGFARLVEKLLNENIFTLGLGGGHDIAYAHFMGIANALQNKNTNAPLKIGIVNFDAHFDLRPIETTGNSGTPFNQILSAYTTSEIKINYLVLGLQKASNTKELFEIAKNNGVDFVYSLDINMGSGLVNAATEKLAAFVENNDHIYISIDLDSIASAYAPGVSAPSPMGLSPEYIFTQLRYLFASKKVIACDIAELNPLYDQDNCTANVAARLVDYIVGL